MDMTVDETAEALVAAGTFRFAGPAPIETINKVEELLDVRFPAAYIIWLLRYGGGGAVGSEISGLYVTGDIHDRGTTLGDSLRFRHAGAIADDMVVLLAHEQGSPWCLRTAAGPNGEYPVVKVEDGKVVTLYPDFTAFFADYVIAWAQDHGNELRKNRPGS